MTNAGTAVTPVRPASASGPFEHPFVSLTGHYVYAVVSPRARGLSFGVNLNPGKYCNFDCAYCEVDRRHVTPNNEPVNIEQLAAELEQTLAHIQAGALPAHPEFQNVPRALLDLKHVTLSGEGEPTLCPNFHEAVETVVHLRASGRAPFFKLVLVTNGSALDRPEVAYGISLLTLRDEIWVKLDGGTQEYMDLINRSQVPLARILDNIRQIARRRPIIIQTMAPLIHGRNPFESELTEYIVRLCESKAAGAKIQLVQIYSATRPTPHSGCGHLPLNVLSGMAKRVRAVTGLSVEVF
jgi:wyosine [tRNA(Phe)-imidazoG37] synthetase (radical SAM superfamily)